MPSPIADQHHLDAAAKAARADAIAARGRSLELLKRLLLILAGDIRDEIGLRAGADGRVPLTQLPTLRAWLDGRLSTFSDRWKVLVNDGITEAAKIGARLLDLVGRTGGDAQVVGQVVEYIRTFKAADGLVLSDRLWRTDRLTRETLRSAIENAIARGESSAQAAQRYLREGLPVPAELQTGLTASQSSAISRRVAQLLTQQAKDAAGYALDRLLRTEMNRAYTESYVATVAQHPDLAGVKFNLSPNHPRVDICDMYASANLHGLGVGVYPAGEHPYPAHPNTLSFLTSVFNDQVSDADRAGKQSAFDWIAQRTPDEQDQILGGTRKGSAFRAGLLLPGELRMPWYHVAARLGINDPEPDA